MWPQALPGTVLCWQVQSAERTESAECSRHKLGCRRLDKQFHDQVNGDEDNGDEDNGDEDNGQHEGMSQNMAVWKSVCFASMGRKRHPSTTFKTAACTGSGCFFLWLGYLATYLGGV